MGADALLEGLSFTTSLNKTQILELSLLYSAGHLWSDRLHRALSNVQAGSAEEQDIKQLGERLKRLLDHLSQSHDAPQG